MRASTTSVLPGRQIKRFGHAVLTTAMLLTTSGAALHAQETSKTVTSMLADGKTIERKAVPQFRPNEILVQLAPGASVEDIIQSYIDSPDIPDVRPVVEQLTSNGSLVSLKFDGTTPGATTVDAVQGFISDDDPRTAGLSSTRLLGALSSASGVVAVSRNYLMYPLANAANDILKSSDSSTGETEDGINEIIDTGKRRKAASGGPAIFPNDVRYANQWHLKLHGDQHGERTSPGGSNFPLMWAKTTGSDKVVIAVIDTGIVASHPDIDFANRILPGIDMVNEEAEFANDGVPGRDTDPTEPPESALKAACPKEFGGANWHGTHVAGIAGAATTNNATGIAGGAWNVKIVPIRALTKCGPGALADIVLGIYWAAGVPIKGIPNNPNPADVINLSLGGRGNPTCSPFFDAAVKAANARGATVVVAAGNESEDVAFGNLASCRNVISVAASDARGYLSPYSNFGSGVDILAPGGDVRRDDNGDGQDDGIISTVDGGLASLNGTSMASPLVAAAAALLKSADPSLTPDQIRQKLKDNALPRTDIQCQKSCGAGLLNMDYQ